MAHTAALYTVRVKERYGDHQPLGNFDGRGTYLLDVLGGYIPALEVTDEEGERFLRCESHAINGEELSAMMEHGKSGLAATIVDEHQNERIRQVWTDTTLIGCGCLFSLPRTQTLGWLALHVNNGTGIKGLLDRGLPTRFRDEFPELMLEIRPFIRGAALRQAIENDQLAKVRLIRYERPNDRANASTNRWLQANQFGKIELDVSPRARGQMLRTTALMNLFGAADTTNHEIFEFAGITFDQVKVEVAIDGRRRTFNLQNPDAGHPMTIDIQPVVDQDGAPTLDSLVEALRGKAAQLGPLN